MSTGSLQAEHHVVQCWHCLAEFDAVGSVWCSCSASAPSKLCPFCLSCFCAAQPEYKEAFWHAAPPVLQTERDTLQHRRMLLGDMLVAAGQITTEQLIRALKRQAESGERLGRVLVDLGFIGNEELDRLLQAQQAPVSFDLHNRVVNVALAKEVGVEACLAHRILPVEMEVLGGRRLLLLAMADPSDHDAITLVQERLQAKVIPGFTPERTIISTLAELFPTQAGSVDLASDGGEVIGTQMLERAIRLRASHLYLEVTPAVSRLSYRVDGVHYRLEGAAGAVDGRHVDALRALFGADGADQRLETGGRTWHLRLRQIRNREATSLTVRFHDPEITAASIQSMHLDGRTRAALVGLGRSEKGLVLLTGPPHSGTGRTWWGLVNVLAAAGRRVALAGAPLSHRLPEIGEWSAPEAPPEAEALCVYRAGAAMLAAAVAESASRLVVLRLVGPRLGSTLAEMLGAGIDVDALTRRLHLLVSQRAVRRICDRCFAPLNLQVSTLRRFGLTDIESTELDVFRGAGCEACRISQGYAGVETVLEAVGGGPELASCIRDFATGGKERLLLPAPLGDSLRQRCLDLVHRGMTTLDEFQKLRLPARG